MLPFSSSSLLRGSCFKINRVVLLPSARSINSRIRPPMNGPAAIPTTPPVRPLFHPFLITSLAPFNHFYPLKIAMPMIFKAALKKEKEEKRARFLLYHFSKGFGLLSWFRTIRIDGRARLEKERFRVSNRPKRLSVVRKNEIVHENGGPRWRAMNV